MKLTTDEKRIVSEEQAAAEAFLCARLKPKGAMKYVHDGKTDLRAQLKWPDLVKLLWTHAIDRMATRATEAMRQTGKAAAKAHRELHGRD